MTRGPRLTTSDLGGKDAAWRQCQVQPPPQTPSSHRNPLAPYGGEARPRIGQTGGYLNNGDGTVTDFETGLQWMRCSLGQTWDGSGCAGKAEFYSWDAAMSAVDELNRGGGYAEHGDWRMPTVEELNSLVYCSNRHPRSNQGTNPFPFAGRRDQCGCTGNFQQPTIDLEAFPNAETSTFWSASPTTHRSDGAWFVNFSSGNDYWKPKGYRFPIRLVRGGQ